ncbi:MAG: Ribosomal protein 50S-L18Ae/60S-L20/60S-L18A [Candidatus Diapherotrites archaeon]|nr:Ribosomal protein 50S-L18Ae/60S-L20/60S-L18A [Candidatus Diapherotrites archaeon]MDN5366885.1 Ribosomal protein 50S-L18Ae/60S-L20/60S-L18A [Candidatus Diapherotrites archaeon]
MWRFVGRYRKGKRIIRFTKEIDAPTKERALEILYSDLGSKHHVKRAQIIIDSVEEVKNEA